MRFTGGLWVVVMSAAVAGQGRVTVPFVGCASVGQADPVAALKGGPVRVNLTAEVAGGLAYYQAGAILPQGCWRRADGSAGAFRARAGGSW